MTIPRRFIRYCWRVISLSEFEFESSRGSRSIGRFSLKILIPLFHLPSCLHVCLNVLKCDRYVLSLSFWIRAVLFNIPVAVVYELMAGLFGLVIYGYYFLLQCDPRTSGSISSQNQVCRFEWFSFVRNANGTNNISKLWISWIYCYSDDCRMHREA